MASEKLQDNFAYPPRWMRADRAAAWTDMSKSKFLELVAQGVMPRGIKVGGMTMWDRLELDAVLEQFKAEEEVEGGKRNTVDMVLGVGGTNERS
jgi:predicted DNA-binding transcriptional regulator AlpA